MEDDVSLCAICGLPTSGPRVSGNAIVTHFKCSYKSCIAVADEIRPFIDPKRRAPRYTDDELDQLNKPKQTAEEFWAALDKQIAQGGVPPV